MVNLFESENSYDVVEGVRVERNDDWFRIVASWVTRQIVRLVSGIGTPDANTPLRAYRNSALRFLVGDLSDESLIPNLQFGILTRLNKFKIAQLDVPVLLRSKENEKGSTWNQTYKSLPSKKFLIFCLLSSMQMMRFIFHNLFRKVK